MSRRDAQADRSAPVVEDERQVPEVERLDQRGDVGDVPLDRVVLGPVRLLGEPEAQQVGRDHAGRSGEAPHEVPVQERPGGLPVQAQDRLAAALFDVVHAAARDGDKAALERVLAAQTQRREALPRGVGVFGLGRNLGSRRAHGVDAETGRVEEAHDADHQHGHDEGASHRSRVEYHQTPAWRSAR